jgi:hypothetical protein
MRRVGELKKIAPSALTLLPQLQNSVVAVNAPTAV